MTNKRVSGLTPFFEKAIEAGELVYEDMVYWQLFDVPGRTDGVALNNPEFFEYTDACDPKQLTQIHLKGKQVILRQLNFYKKYVKMPMFPIFLLWSVYGRVAGFWVNMS